MIAVMKCQLKLNDENTEFLIMISRNQQHKIHYHDIKVDTATVAKLTHQIPNIL